MDLPDAARIWELYGRHAGALFAGGPRAAFEVDEDWFFAASGAHHVDLNQAALFGAASSGDADVLTRRILKAGVPSLLGCSAGVVERVAGALTQAGFTRLPKEEALFWRPGPPAVPGPAPFRVRRVRSERDIAAMESIFLEAHGYPPELIRELYGGRVGADDGLSAWIAWDGVEPVSFTIVMEVGTSLSLWEVMTPERHRRRGGARAVVLAGLAGAASAAAQAIEETLFWASPAGRPLYDAMGFEIVDTVDAWTLGASPEDLAAVGA